MAGENGSEQLFFGVFPLSVSEPECGNTRENRRMAPTVSTSTDTPHRFTLHSFPVQYVPMVELGRTLLHAIIQGPKLPPSSGSQGPQVLHWIVEVEEENVEQ